MMCRGLIAMILQNTVLQWYWREFTACVMNAPWIREQLLLHYQNKIYCILFTRMNFCFCRYFSQLQQMMGPQHNSFNVKKSNVIRKVNSISFKTNCLSPDFHQRLDYFHWRRGTFPRTFINTCLSSHLAYLGLFTNRIFYRHEPFSSIEPAKTIKLNLWLHITFFLKQCCQS